MKQSFCFQSQSRYAYNKTSVANNVFLFILLYVTFIQTFLLFIDFYSGHLAITHNSILLSYYFSCKRIRNNFRENIVKNSSMYKQETLLCRNILITFFCVNFSLCFVSNCVYLRKFRKVSF